MAETANVVPLWQGPAPLAIGAEPADVPSIELVTPATGATGSCVLVCPGGGYGNLAAHEGVTIGEFLASHGIIGAVLKYRIAPRYKHPAPKLDVSRGIRLLRHRAAEWGIDPNRVGILGYSAGGHLAGSVTTNVVGDAPDDAGDAASALSPRPDFSALIYPVISMRDGRAHKGSRAALLGADAPADRVERYSLESRVTSAMPPVFLAHADDDKAVPIGNATAFVEAALAAGVPVHFEHYRVGGHGFGMGVNGGEAAAWPARFEAWLAERGMR